MKPYNASYKHQFQLWTLSTASDKIFEVSTSIILLRLFSNIYYHMHCTTTPGTCLIFEKDYLIHRETLIQFDVYNFINIVLIFRLQKKTKYKVGNSEDAIISYSALKDMNRISAKAFAGELLVQLVKPNIIKSRSLTGARSPACPDKPALPALDPGIITAIYRK